MPTTGLKFIFVLICFLAPYKHNSVFSEQNKNSFYVPLPPYDIRYNSTRKFYKNKRNLYLKKWVVYAKPSFGGIDQVIEYLGSYTHRIAISNYRILELGSTHLRFSYLDRKRGTVGIERIRGEEFVLRFLQHVLPKRFTKIRHYGFLSTRSKSVDLPKIRRALKVNHPPAKKKWSPRQIMIATQGKDPYICPKCQLAELVVVAVFPSIRGSPPRFFSRDKKVRLL